MKPANEIRPIRVVLKGVFASHPPLKGTLHHVLLLENTGLFYQKLQAQNRFSSAEVQVNQFVDPECYGNYDCLHGRDIVGCQCMKDPPPATDEDGANVRAEVSGQSDVRSSTRRAYFCVYSYPIGKTVFGIGERRQRLSITFTVDAHDTFVENLAVAELWRDAIRCCAHGPSTAELKLTATMIANNEIANGSSTSLNQRRPFQVCQHRRRLLILVNPHSGPGKAGKIFQERVAPLLAEAGVSYDLVTTARAKEAQDIAREVNLNDWHGIVIVSGDGLVFEVINGLMERPDWSSAIRIPIGIIPGGSGNGLAKTISYASREPQKTNQILLAAFIVAKGRATPMDVIRVTMTSGTLYSFLSIGWGIIADIDIESERLRALGGSRFTIWALARIIDLRVYRGRLSYLPANHAVPSSANSCNEDRRVLKGSQSSTGDSQDAGLCARDLPTQPPQRSASYPLEAAHTEAANVLQDEESGAIRNPDRLEDVSNGTNGCSPESSQCNGEEGYPSLLPPLDEPLPESWVQGGEEDFVLVYVAFQSHISSSALVAPDASLDDGLMWMMVVRKGVTRSQLVSFLLAIDSGTHITLPYVEMKPVHAFRLEPISAGGYLTVDGELVEYGPVQAEVLRGIARVMAH